MSEPMKCKKCKKMIRQPIRNKSGYCSGCYNIVKPTVTGKGSSCPGDVAMNNQELWWILNGCPSVTDDVGSQTLNNTNVHHNVQNKVKTAGHNVQC